VATSARRLALRILGEVVRPQRTLAPALDQPEVAALDPRDRAFLHELVLGTLRRRGWLDHVLAQVLDHPAERLPDSLRDALRLGAYQLLFLRVPAHAAVAETVSLVRERSPRAAGLANAVLRRLQREGPPPEPDPVADVVRWLSTAGSLPPWLAERWLRRLGPERAVARARALLDPAPVHFRYNPRVADAQARAHAAGLAPRPAAVPGAWEATGGRVSELAAEGVIYVQDQGSQLVARLAARPRLVLDACAAPGGKALLLADELEASGGRVVAADASPSRLRTLAELRRRWASPNLSLLVADAARPPFSTVFDALLLDAPCSALGTLARHPDVRWRSRASDIARHSRRQSRLLEALSPLVGTDGLLVYATCSDEEEETEAVVARFLEDHPEFEPATPPEWARPFTDGRFLRTCPETHGGDAFFVAPLQRPRGDKPRTISRDMVG